MAKKPVKITEVVLRDAHQSLLATRMTMDEMRPILPEMDKIPYFSVECWGGATFDSCIRFLDEDPWERLRILRKELPHQKLQMLFRGQNMLGYRPYADDAVQYLSLIHICRLRYWQLWQPYRSCCCTAWQPVGPQCPPTCWWCGCLARRCGWGFWRWCFPLCRCWTRCSTGQACCLVLCCA